jgi:hypothetical protein
LFNLLGQSMPITTVQDANSIRGMSRCTRYKLYVTNICKQLVVDVYSIIKTKQIKQTYKGNCCFPLNNKGQIREICEIL